MIYPARRIIYVSIVGFFFERVRKHIWYAHDNKHLPLEYTLDVTVVLEQRQSIGFITNSVFGIDICISINQQNRNIAGKQDLCTPH